MTAIQLSERPEANGMGEPVTLILPCLNEEQSMPSVVQEARDAFSSARIPLEIVVVDNGSTDGSVDLAIELGVRVITEPTRGYGAALRRGIVETTTEIAVMADLDGSYVIRDSVEMVRMVERGVDLVVGNRFLGKIEPGAMPWLHRYLGNPILSFLGRHFYRAPIGDFHCGLRAFRVETIQSLGLRSNGMEFASEMIARAALGGVPMSEIATSLRPDLRDREPHLRTWFDGWRHLRFLFAFAPRWAFLYPSLGLGAFGAMIFLLGALGPTSVWGIGLGVKSSIAGAALLQVALSGIWAHLIAQASMDLMSARRRARPELVAIASLAVALLGLVAYISLALEWSAVDFGPQDLREDLWLALLGGVAISSGGSSFALYLSFVIVSSRFGNSRER